MQSTRWASCLCVVMMACNGSAKPPADAPKVTEKPVLAEPPAPAAEPTPSEGVEEAAEAPVPEQEDMPNVPTSPLPPSVVLKANELEPGRENLVLAPITALLALEMTLPGARGETAKQLEQALGLKPAQALLVAKELARLAGAPGAGNKLMLSNGLYTEEAIAIQPAFEKELREGFHANRLGVPFAKDPEAARARINQDVATHTGDRLKELLGPGSVDNLTRAVLVSAVAMLAQWKEAFDPARTQDGPFTRREKPSVQVPFMQRGGEFSLGMLGEDTTVLELPYGGGKLSMVVVLPSGDRAPKEVFDADTLGRTLERLEPAKAVLELPRFTAKLESTNLIPLLQNLGVRDLFAKKADLSGIAGKPGDLYVSHALHGAFVDVNEKGTEAAGATAVAIRTRSAAAQEPPVIAVNRPFVFLIRQISSGLILFAGRIGDPSLKP